MKNQNNSVPQVEAMEAKIWRGTVAEYKRLPFHSILEANKIEVMLPDGTVAVVKNRFGECTHSPIGRRGRRELVKL